MIKKFYAKPKVFDPKFYAGLRVKVLHVSKGLAVNFSYMRLIILA